MNTPNISFHALLRPLRYLLGARSRPLHLVVQYPVAAGPLDLRVVRPRHPAMPTTVLRMHLPSSGTLVLAGRLQSNGQMQSLAHLQHSTVQYY